MPPLDVLKSARSDTVIPDCCNIGVIFRVLLAVNTSVLVAILLHSAGWMAALLDFVESAMIVELSCLLSLLSLCGLRNLLAVRTLQQWAQRALCGLVPAILTAAIVHFFSTFDWFQSSFAHLTVTEGMLLAALFGIASQHYFELRSRAFSPALTEARLQALQARIRPHFLFNSLNAVLSLMRSAPRQAETALEDLADLFRVLMRDARNMTSLDEELLLCRQYLSIEKIRLGERLQVQWEMSRIDADLLPGVQMPALLLQPLLENAVHYGVEPALEPALIRISISRSIDRIEIVVVNPYHRDTPESKGNHMALTNIRERLALLYDVEAQLTSAVTQGQFEVRLRFPYMKVTP